MNLTPARPRLDALRAYHACELIALSNHSD